MPKLFRLSEIFHLIPRSFSFKANEQTLSDSGKIDTPKFFKDISIVFIFKLISSALIFLISIMTARILTPAEFGEIGLINNLQYIWLIPVLMGLNFSMYKYLPDSSRQENDELKTAALLGNIAMMILWAFLYLYIYGWLKDYIKISAPLWRLGIVSMMILDLYMLSESFLRGQKKYSFIARLKLASTLIFFLIFIGLYCFHNLDVAFYFYALFISYGVYIIIAFRHSDFHTFPISWPMFKQIYPYGFLNMINTALTTVLYSADLLIINYFFSGKDVGIYWVYQGFVKNWFSVLFYEVFSVVFLPTIASMDKNKLAKTMQRFVPFILLFSIIVTFLFTAMVVWLSGKQYGLNWLYVLLVSTGIGFYAIFQIYNTIFSMEGKQGATQCLIPLAITVPVALCTQFFFTKYYGIVGTMIGVIITNIFILVVFRMTVLGRQNKCTS